MLHKCMLVFLGGGTGSVLRYAISVAMANRPAAVAFPWATFAANIAGCFLIGLFYALSAKLNLSADARLLLTTGLCGGFTTFSTFSNEGVAMLAQGRYVSFAVYLASSIIFGLGAVFLGSIIAK